MQTGAQANAVAGRLRNGDRIYFCGRFLGSRIFRSRIDVSALGPALNRRGGNNGEVVQRVNEQVDIHKLVRKERIISVGKHGLELVRPGGQVDLIVDGLEFSAGEFGSIVAVVGIHGELDPAMEFGVHLRKLILRQAENHRYRLELRND